MLTTSSGMNYQVASIIDIRCRDSGNLSCVIVESLFTQQRGDVLSCPRHKESMTCWSGMNICECSLAC